MEKNVPDGGNFEPGLTNLFEIVAVWNRIVVNYNFEGLVHLVTLDNETGFPVDVSWSEPIRTAKTIPLTDIQELQKLDEPTVRVLLSSIRKRMLE